MSTYYYEQKDHQQQKDSERRGSGVFSNQIFKDVKEGLYRFPVLKIKNRCNYDKLKHYLKQSSKRLSTEILAKIELVLKQKCQTAEHIKKREMGLAISLVVQIEKQRQLKEAMEKVMTYCEVLLNRFTLLQNVKCLDDISAEAVSSIIWASQRIAMEELRQVAEQLSNKYGKCYVQACQKKQVATINEKLVSQISPTVSQVVVEKYLVDISEEYNIVYVPANKDVKTAEDLLDLWDSQSITDKEVGLLTDEPLVAQSTSSILHGASQLSVPNMECRAPSPGGSCRATSPGGTKEWCHFDVSPAKDSSNLNPFCTHNIAHQSRSPSSLDFGASRNNPFLEDLQGINHSDKDLVTLKNADMTSYKVSNPFKELVYQDYIKGASPYQQYLFQVDSTDNESGVWNTKSVEPDLLFEMDLEEIQC